MGDYYDGGGNPGGGGADHAAGKFVFRLNDHGQGPELLRQVFLERGWAEFDEDTQAEDDWNLWWRTSRFRNCDYEELRSYQQVNHYPRSTAITKKDSLARNLKRMRGVYGPSVYNFSPLAFNLPNDYTKFVAEYTRLKEKNNGKDLCWICKPADLSRGRGIFIFRDLSELQYDCNAVVQQYLTNPMLISGYKFDLRIYVMVPSFHPLNIYIYQEGLVRFSTEKFNLNALGNMFSHLTNTSINKYSPSYTADKERVGPGCKWTITQLRHYFHQINIDDDILWRKIVNIVILTLVLQANQVPKVSNCFELYGFDIIIDDQLKPWLLEVNFSPALSSDCQTDLQVKKPMLHDLFDFLNFSKKDQLRSAGTSGHNSRDARSVAKAASAVMAAERRASGAGGALPGRGGGGGGASGAGARNYPHPRLPHIAANNSNSLMQSHSGNGNSAHAYLAEGCEEDDEEVLSSSDRGSNDVVPVIPGCGLPSVQQPAIHSWRSGNNNYSGGSSRGSSASSRKSGGGGGAGEERAESQAGSDCWRSGTSSVVHRHSHHHQHHHRGMIKRVDSKGSQLSHLASPEVPRSPPVHNNRHSQQQQQQQQAQQLKGKRESKVSIQSDSGVSSCSGSSDNSDNNQPPPADENSNANNRKSSQQTNIQSTHNSNNSSKKLISSQEVNNNNANSHLHHARLKGGAATESAPRIIQNTQQKADTAAAALGSKSVASITNASSGLMNRYALTEHVPDALKPPQSNTAVVSVTRSQSLPRGTRSSALRSSMHNDASGGKKKYGGQFGYPANPLLASKSGMLNRRGSLNNMLSAQKLANNYAKPWRRQAAGHNNSGSDNLASQKATSQKNSPARKRVGDFFLAYPFNEATRKCSAGNQDVKVVIRETQKLLKEFTTSGALKAPLFDALPLWLGTASQGADRHRTEGGGGSTTAS